MLNYGSARVKHTVRFGLGILMRHFLGSQFTPECLELAASVRSSEYYVNMMTAWFFATALAKRYDETISYIESGRLDGWTQRKAIQKSIESRRLTDGHKEYLRSLNKPQ